LTKYLVEALEIEGFNSQTAKPLNRPLIRSAAVSSTWSVHITKQGTPKFTTKAHYILATISLKFRAQITKFQGTSPKVFKHGISLVFA
jgi:hypothetical protein